MNISFQGYGHFFGRSQLNNQDFAYSTDKMLLITDGCSGCIHSELGTRLFGQLFTKLPSFECLDAFEKNVNEIFDDMIAIAKKRCKDETELEQFIMDNYLFTIWACFKTEQGFTVKFFGDGYIITQNTAGNVSYIKFNYGKYPPYYGYTYCPSQKDNMKRKTFKTLNFSKDEFKTIGIGTDGCSPFAKGDVADMDNHIINASDGDISRVVQLRYENFSDDVSIVIFDGDGRKVLYNSEPTPEFPTTVSKPFNSLFKDEERYDIVPSSEKFVNPNGESDRTSAVSSSSRKVVNKTNYTFNGILYDINGEPINVAPIPPVVNHEEVKAKPTDGQKNESAEPKEKEAKGICKKMIEKCKKKSEEEQPINQGNPYDWWKDSNTTRR